MSSRQGQFPSSVHSRLCNEIPWLLAHTLYQHSFCMGWACKGLFWHIEISSNFCSVVVSSWLQQGFHPLCVNIWKCYHWSLGPEYDALQKHVIYYVSHRLFRPSLRYSHEEKMTLTIVFSVWKLRHYILMSCMRVTVGPSVNGRSTSWPIILLQPEAINKLL